MITNEMIQKRLREAIRASGWKQKVLAKELNVSQAMISSYLCKNKMPSLETFANLCRVLHRRRYSLS